MSKNGPPGAVPGPSKLAEQLEVTPSGHVEQVTAAVSYRVVDSPGFLKELGASWAECLSNIEKPEHREKLLQIKPQMNDVELMAFGYNEMLIDLGRAANEEKMEAGVDSFLGAEIVLKKEVPGLVSDVPFAALRETRAYYGFVLAMQKASDRYEEGLEVLRTHAGQHLSGWGRQLYGRLSGSLGLHKGLGGALERLTAFVVGPALAGAETRKTNAALTSKVEQATLEKAQAGAPQPAAPASATPATPAADPATPQGGTTRPKARI